MLILQAFTKKSQSESQSETQTTLQSSLQYSLRNLEKENDFLKEQIKKKDEQIEALTRNLPRYICRTYQDGFA